jgi:hypothetical protein
MTPLASIPGKAVRRAMSPWNGWMKDAGRAWRVGLGMLLLLGLVGCVRNRAQPLAPLLAEGRANELKATAQHRGERMRVWGVVVSAGLKKVDRLIAKKAEPLNIYSTSVEVEQVRRSYPYVYLRAPDANADDGKLLCFFTLDSMGALPDLKPDTAIVVIGDFQEYSDRGHTLVLNGCELADDGPSVASAAW